MNIQNRQRKYASADGWSIATALGLLTVAFLWDRMAPLGPTDGSRGLRVWRFKCALSLKTIPRSEISS